MDENGKEANLSKPVQDVLHVNSYFDYYEEATHYLLDKDIVLVSSDEEFNFVANEMLKDSIHDFENYINKIRKIVLMNKKKRFQIS